MAKAKVETNNEYLDANAGDFSAQVQTLLLAERAAYEVLKAAKAEVLKAVKAEISLPAGREVKTTLYTRWGQWQVVVGDVVRDEPKAGARQSLAEYMAAQAAQGRGH